MTETELEKLVVRLTGDGSSYQKMVKEGVEGSRSLATAIKGVENANRQMDSYMHSSTTQWREHNRTMNETKILLAEYTLHLKSGAQAWNDYKNNAKQAISEIKSQVVGLAQAWVASTNIFGSGSSLPSRLLNVANPGSWAEMATGFTSAIRANMNTVMRDESTYSVGANGWISVSPKKRWITAAEAEREDYRKSLNPRYLAISKEEREYRRSLKDQETNSIENRQDRIKAMRGSVVANLNDEMKAKREAELLTRQLENVERNVVGRGSAAISSVWNWTANPYEANITKLREKRDLARKEHLEAEDRRRKSVRDVEEAERSGKKSDDEMVKDLMRKNAKIGMNSKQSAMFDMKNAGVNEATMNAVFAEMSRGDSLRLKRSLEDEEVERGYIGKKSREVRDLKTRRSMQQAGYQESEIQDQLSSFAKTDKAKDADELATKIKEVVKALREQADAFRDNNDVMKPYSDILDKITDKEQKAKFVADVKAADRDRRHGAVMQSRPQERFRQAEAQINQLHEENAISMAEKEQALAQARRDIFGGPSGSGFRPSGPVDAAEYGSGDALSRLSQFRELAFGKGGYAQSKGPTKTTVRQRQAIARAKAASPRQTRQARLDAAKARLRTKRPRRMTMFRALHGYGMGENDPTAGAVSRMLADGGMRESSDGLTLPEAEQATTIGPAQKPEERGGMSIFSGGASDYWGTMNRNSNDGLDPTKSKLLGDNDTDKKSEEHLRNIAEKFKDNSVLLIKLADLK